MSGQWPTLCRGGGLSFAVFADTVIGVVFVGAALSRVPVSPSEARYRGATRGSNTEAAYTALREAF